MVDKTSLSLIFEVKLKVNNKSCDAALAVAMAGYFHMYNNNIIR